MAMMLGMTPRSALALQPLAMGAEQTQEAHQFIHIVRSKTTCEVAHVILAGSKVVVDVDGHNVLAKTDCTKDGDQASGRVEHIWCEQHKDCGNPFEDIEVLQKRVLHLCSRPFGGVNRLFNGAFGV
eukprot:2639345-Prymnesium_polylepis.1